MFLQRVALIEAVYGDVNSAEAALQQLQQESMSQADFLATYSDQVTSLGFFALSSVFLPSLYVQNFQCKSSKDSQHHGSYHGCRVLIDGRLVISFSQNYAMTNLPAPPVGTSGSEALT